MSFSIKVNGEYLPGNVVVKDASLNMDVSETGKKILSMKLIDKNNSSNNYYLIDDVVGKKIEMYENGILRFGGQLDLPKTNKINRSVKNQDVICVDWNFLAEKRYVNRVYSRQKITDIVKKIIDEYLMDDGVFYDSNSIEEIDNQLAINCSYAKAANLFDEMSSLIAYNWNIGPDKKFYFQSRSSQVGPVIIEEQSNYLPQTLIYSEDRSDYRNTQILKNVNALTSTLTEKATPTPDNDNNFFVRFPIDRRPEFFVTDDINNIPENDYDGYTDSYRVPINLIGIGGLDQGLSWYYWNKGNSTVSKDPDNAPEFTTGYFLVVRYIGQYKVDIISTDDDAIVNRINIEGGTGIYENVEDGSNIDGIIVGEEKANALIQRFSSNAKKIIFQSYTINAEVNQICNLTFPSFKINGVEYLVISKKVKDVGAGNLLKTYTLASGEAIGGWVTFFKKWLQTSKDFTLREDEDVLQQLRERESWKWGGNVAVLVYNLLFPSPTLFPSKTLFPGSFNAVVNYDEG